MELSAEASSGSWIEALPKTDLHVHLDGSLRPETLLELAQQQGVVLGDAAAPVRTLADLERVLAPGRVCESLVDYLRAFDFTLRVLQQPEALARVAYELAEDTWREGGIYLEVRFAPFLHTQAELSEDAVVEAVLAGLARAELDFAPLRARLIICGLRHLDPEVTLRMVRLALRYREAGVVAIDLAGPEAGFGPELHHEALALARTERLAITLHAGEAAGPTSIRAALAEGASRLGHGCRLREDEALLAEVVAAKIPLECCLLSNVQTRAVTALADHPILDYQRQGVVVTLNTDNRFVTKTTLTAELERLVGTLRPSFEEITTLLRAGLQAAFLSDIHQRAELEAVFESRVHLARNLYEAQLRA